MDANPTRKRRRRAVLLPLLLTLASTPLGIPAANASGPVPKLAAPLAPHVPGTVLVGFRHGATRADRAAARNLVGAVAASPLSPLATDAERWTLGGATTVAASIEALRRNPLVRYAEPDYLMEKDAVSNDPYYLSGTSPLWGMHGDAISPNANQYGTGADEAWAAGWTGSSSVYVGVVDEGIQFTHPDLAQNIWTNPWDPVDGIDNDGNGYVDDTHGWDFFNNDSGMYDAGYDAHGTHVSGTIGGVGGNGIGVAGVNWNVTIISGKFLGPSGGSTSGAVLAVDYLTDLKTRHGIDLVATSNSWGGGGFSQALLDAINRGGDANILFVAAAGNSSSNNDAVASYPSNYQCTNGGTRGWDCVVAVAAIDSSGNRASFTSYGATTVDIGAPGVGVWSSVPTDSYASYSGTSMATPHVSGAVALCESINPALGAQDLRNAVLNSGAATASLAGFTVTGDRLDVGALGAACQPATAPPSGVPAGLGASASSTSQIALTWTDGVSGESSYEIQRAVGTLGSCGTWVSIASVGADATSFAASGLSSSTSYCFRVRAANSYAGGSSTAWSNEASATTLAPPPAYVCEATAYGWLDASGGTALAMTDDSSRAVSLPFSFTTYGQTYASVVVSSNGFLRLGTSIAGATAYTNAPIPSVADPNGIVAPFWDDLNPGAGGQVYAATLGTAPNRSFVVAWVNVPSYWVTGSAATFEAVLEEGTDVVRFQYQDVTFGNASYDAGASATVGIEGETGEWGTQVAYNSPLLTAPSAYRCSAGSGTSPTILASSPPDGTTGASYTATFTASGGTAPYTWSLASGALPVGLALDPSAGVVAGTPTTPGSSTFTLRVADAAMLSAIRTFAIRVAAPLSITTSSLPNASLNGAYSQTLASTGGQSPITWALKAGSSLPTGLSLSATGTIAGTPSASGATAFTVVATDAGLPSPRSAEKTLSITVVPPPTITTSSLPDATTTVAYSVALAATGGATPYTWSLASGTLPAGLGLSSAGLISGTPSSTGTSSFTVKVTGSDGGTSTLSTSIRVAAPLSITTSSLPNASLNGAYSQTLASTGGQSPITWALKAGSSLPTGLSLSATGTIAGTPSASGATAFTVVATDAGLPSPRSAEKTLSITVVPPPTITTSSLPDATTTVAYSVALAATGGATPYTWSLASGTLPAGLGLSSAGLISGTPSSTGTSSFTVKVTGSDGGTSTLSTSIRVAAPLSITTSSLPNASLNGAYSQTLASTGGQSPITWALKAGSSLPTGLSLSATGTIAGTPSASGATAFTVVATDAGLPSPRSAEKTLSITVVPPPTITTSSLPDATTTVAYSVALAATGGATPYTWSLASGTLPAGLGLSSAGLISGTPSSTGTSSFTVKVTGSDGGTSTLSTSIRVAAPLSITTSSLPNASLNGAYSQTLASTGGQSPITWALKAGSSLPTGLSLSATGTIAGTPSASGATAFTVVATDAGLPSPRSAEKTLSITVVPPPTITTSSLPDATTTVAYSVALAATGGATPYTWSLASGTLPAGLGLSSAGLISGTPSSTGTSSFTVKVTGSDGGTSTLSTSIRVAAPLSITTSSLPAPTLGSAYAQSIVATGGTGPYAWAIASGMLPPGLVLDPTTGSIAGIADTSGTFVFTIGVQDSGGPPRLATKSFTITIASAKRSPVSGTALASGLLTPTLTWWAVDGATSYRWCVTTTSKGCAATWNGTTTSSTLSVVTATLSRGKTYYWQVEAFVGGAWVGANGGTYWRFTTAR